MLPAERSERVVRAVLLAALTGACPNSAAATFFEADPPFPAGTAPCAPAAGLGPLAVPGALTCDVARASMDDLAAIPESIDLGPLTRFASATPGAATVGAEGAIDPARYGVRPPSGPRAASAARDRSVSAARAALP